MKKNVKHYFLKLINNTHIKNLIYSFLAICGIEEFVYLCSHKERDLIFSILYIFIFYLFYKFLLNNSKYKISRREINFSRIFSIILSAALIIGAQLDAFTKISWSFITIFKIFCLYLFLLPIFKSIIFFIKHHRFKKNNKLNSKKIYPIAFLSILFFGLIIWLALFPGVYGYDAGFQFFEATHSNFLNDKFSLLFVFFMGGLIQFGKFIFNNYQAGFALYTLAQLIILSLSSAKIVNFIAKKTLNNSLFLFSLLFFCLFPPYTILAISSTQDVLFTAIFVLIVINLYYLVSEHKSWDNKKLLFCLAIELFLLCLARNNGVYCLLVTLFFLFIRFYKKWKIIFLVFTAPLLAYFIYAGPVFSHLQIKRSNMIAEMTSIPHQQIARTFLSHSATIPPSYKKELKKFYPDFSVFKYHAIHPSISDDIKIRLDSKAVKKAPFNYFNSWLSLGLQHPKNYIEAFLMQTLALWYPNKNYQDSRMYHPFIEFNMLKAKQYDRRFITIHRDSKIPILESMLSDIIISAKWKRWPILSIFFIPATYFWIFLFIFGLVILRKKFNYLVILSIFIGLYLTVLLCPVMLFRYFLPTVVLLPFLLFLLFFSCNK